MEGYKNLAVTLLLLICCSCQVQKQTNSTQSQNAKSKHQISFTMDTAHFKLPPLKYKLDTQNNNPFDVNAKENIFFYDGAYSCLVSDRKELNTFHDQSKTIVVFDLERIDLVRNEHIVKKFGYPEDFKSPNNKAQFMLLTNEENISYFNRNEEVIAVTSYLVTVQGKFYGPLSSMVWDDYATCQAYAKKFSQESGKTILVSQILSISDRH